MNIDEIRRQNLRNLIGNTGGPGELSKAAGINLSFLVQMTGPNPSRAVTEKTARKCETAMNLPEGTLDVENGVTEIPRPPTRRARTSAYGAGMDIDQIMSLIRLLGEISANENVTLFAPKFVDILALALVDTASHKNNPRPEYIERLVRLAK